MRKVLLAILLCFPVALLSQDFSFSQFYEMPMLRNPALSGIFNGDIRVSSVYRNQWASVTVPFQTRALGVEYKKSVNDQSNSYYTFGLQMTYDKAGDLALKRIQVLPVITYHQSLSNDNDTYLSGSFMLGGVLSNFDPSKAQFDDQFRNGSYSPGNVSAQILTNTGISYIDMSAGLVFSSNYGEDSRFYIGTALFHLNKPKLNFFNADANSSHAPKLVFNAGLSTPFTERSQIIAYVDYYQQTGNKQLFGGMLYEFPVTSYLDDGDNIKLSVGAFYRWNDALIPAFKIQASKLMLGLSYDANGSQLRTGSQYRGGMEITLSFLGFLKGESSSRNKVRCPRFGGKNNVGWWYSK
ncbi:MAG: PorP/SprF family type IX secretion system membrane protein [Chitinophagaceae bacterium]|nr:PorP/SprF family type IX secretion system membrane protein [Chitinophagaceae bacterium]